jgi:hypothetical protein
MVAPGDPVHGAAKDAGAGTDDIDRTPNISGVTSPGVDATIKDAGATDKSGV